MRFSFKATEITDEHNTIIFEVEVEALDIFEAQKILLNKSTNKTKKKRRTNKMH